MRPAFLVLLLNLVIPSMARAQSSETVDLVTFKLPAGFTKTATSEGVQFTLQEPSVGAACAVSVYNAVAGSTDAKENFTTAWTTLVTTLMTVTTPPVMSSVTSKKGWKSVSGRAPFEFSGTTGEVLLVTTSGSGKAVNVMVTTNNPKRYKKLVAGLLASMTFKVPVAPATASKATASEATVAKAPETPIASPASTSSILGTWGRGSSVTSSGGSFGRYRYTKQQYTFNANGTYSYLRKNYVEDNKETYLTREAGTYTIRGDTLTLAPRTNVIEAWSKANGGDNYKQLLSSQKQPLEKTTYRWVIHYFAELKESDLVLLADTETVRDGSYNATEAFPKGWRLSPTSLANPSYTAITLP